MKISEDMIDNIKNHFGYNNEQMQTWLQNPRNHDVLSKSLNLLNKTIVIEVIESHGCNSLHRVGDKFYFDGAGNLLTRMCPNKICIFALSAVDKLIFTANELLYAGVDPNEMRFKRVPCTADVGLECGGWGKIIMEIKIVERNKVNSKSINTND